MSDEPKYRDEEWLREQYVEQEHTIADIADGCDCSRSVVCKWLKKNKIQTRPSAKPADPRLTDAEWLQEQYTQQQKTIAEIAEKCDCSETPVRNWLEKHGIKRRSPAKPADPRLTDAEWLRNQYIKNQKTTVDIASACDCTAATVSNWLDKHGIGTRWHKERSDPRLTDEKWLREKYLNDGLTTYEIADKLSCAQSSVQERLKNSNIQTRCVGGGSGGGRPPEYPKLTDKTWLEKRYKKDGFSSSKIANICGCRPATVIRWLHEHGIDTRPAHPTGKDHPRYNGGPKPYGPGWNDKKRREVRERDGYTCQDPRCSVTQDEHLNEHDEKLHVHHLRKARDVDDPEERNAPENLITLCRDCHNRWEKIADTGLVPQLDAGETAD